MRACFSFAVLAVALVASASPATADPGATRDPVAVCGVPNGCGPASGPRSDGLFYNPSCSTHDKCYAMIGKTQERCDADFLKDMYAQCGTMVGPCADGARTMYGLPSVLGRSAYVAAQQCAGKVDLENTESDLNAIAKTAPDHARSASSATVREVGLEMTTTRIRLGRDAADVKAAAARVAQLQAQYPVPSGPATIASLTSGIGAQLNAVAARMAPIVDDTNAKMPKRELQLAAYVETTTAAAGEAAVAARSGEVIKTVNEARALRGQGATATEPSLTTLGAYNLKVKESRAKYASLKTLVTEDVRAGSLPAIRPLDAFAAEIKSNSVRAAALKAEAEAIVAAAPPSQQTPSKAAPSKAPIAPAPTSVAPSPPPPPRPAPAPAPVAPAKPAPIRAPR